jgi:hypothetical protein
MCSAAYEPEIGDVDEGVVLDAVSIGLESIRAVVSCLRSWRRCGQLCVQLVSQRFDDRRSRGRSPTAKNELTLPDLGAQGDVLLRRTSGLLGGHLDCDPVVLGLCGCCSCECTSRQSLIRILMGAVRNALLKLAVRGRRKRGTAEIPGSSPKYPRTVAPLFACQLDLFLVPTKRIFFPDLLRTRQPATPRRSTTRKDGSHVCLTPIPFLNCLNGIVACHLTSVCRLAWSSHWMLFPASSSNRASLQLDPSRDSPSFLQAWEPIRLVD